jgi:arginyl-tRNA--protein-N-Asp/Glu arginylyltransferase
MYYIYHKHFLVLQIQLLDIMDASLHRIFEVYHKSYMSWSTGRIKDVVDLQSLVSSSEEVLASGSSAIYTYFQEFSL